MGYSKFHKAVVRQALSECKPVPPEVLRDYPDLVKQPATRPPEAETLAKPIINTIGKVEDQIIKDLAKDDLIKTPTSTTLDVKRSILPSKPKFTPKPISRKPLSYGDMLSVLNKLDKPRKTTKYKPIKHVRIKHGISRI